MVAMTAARSARPATASTIDRTRRRRAAPSRKSGMASSRVDRTSGGDGATSTGTIASSQIGRATVAGFATATGSSQMGRATVAGVATATGHAASPAIGRASVAGCATLTGSADGGRGGGVTRLGRVSCGNGGGHARGLVTAVGSASRAGGGAAGAGTATRAGGGAAGAGTATRDRRGSTARLACDGGSGMGRGGRGLMSEPSCARPAVGGRASVTLGLCDSWGIDESDKRNTGRATVPSCRASETN